MTSFDFSRHAWLDLHGVIGYPLAPSQCEEIDAEWLATFCSGVRRKTGEGVYRGYRWHAFSYGFDSALCGDEAVAAYRGVARATFRVMFEDGAVFECFGSPGADLSGTDCYLFPSSFSWMIAFTHEQGIGLGPYFVSR